ncbi:ABC transporter permease [Streptomyces cocklensis]|uniref:Oligopeptide transport system permease protein n=1 Tax=Actinacidiphila cocklensis TaxID=887465 RepID=A0A9W4GQ44_9ACTN|nr:ABC transporter permease [Actinacidiphila cocklensis]MDD1062008.1 ABC transporter permease [Actinacidiphila cocklensis]WSX74750.1 ABC transporter permease [Streptomyces sp. NBC_00899]CAG6391196.1 Oligopeptide transport system permease protein [Actinacidiphila cocklensis]
MTSALQPTAPAAAAEPAAAGPAARPGEPGTLRRLLRRPRFFLPLGVVVLLCAMAAVPSAFAGWFGHGDPHQCSLEHSGQGPAPGHPFGFDVQGCDLYSNVVHGARDSISIGLLTTALTLVVAVVLGSLAGYFGGVADMLISRLMDVFFGFPMLVGMIVVLETFSVHSILSVSLVLALFSWPVLTRIMRSSVLATRGLDYVTAARELGAGPVRILLRHAIPNAIMPVAVLTSINIGGVITAEASLTFLGVGLTAPAISWGVQLNSAQQYFTTHPGLLLFPALFLSLAVLSFVLLGDCLRDAFDPRLR